MKSLAGILIVFALLALAYSQKNEDEIISLPGISANLVRFKQYSGYLNATGTRRFHYWFVESEGNPAKDPLVLWLNGGPGCSSLDGLFSENGPFLPSNDGKTLTLNPFRWNLLANVIYLESPAGVGFSYSSDATYKTTDDEVAEDNYQALQHFFLKYPNFTSNQLFLTGESYAGVYVPTLAVKILEGNNTINMQGFAIGNPLVSRPLNVNSLMYFAFWHGIVGAQLWEEMLQYCCTGDDCTFYKTTNIDCKSRVDMVHSIVFDIGLNTYGLYSDCYKGIPPHLHRYVTDMKGVFDDFESSWVKIQHAKKNRTKVSPAPTLGKLKFSSSLICINASAETAYLSSAEVRKAIHIPSNLPTWAICSDDVANNYVKTYEDLTPEFNKLLKSYRALIYNGDTDMQCNFFGGEWFVENLKQPLKMKYREWMYKNQVAGFVKDFDKITFMTVKGSGHMVPQWKPAEAFQMISNFLKNKLQ
ncbi:lysosomal protective protein-like [Anneissia japonica]|uniref:lysosomal protective protein-like n=1 Tax=Anneissia japonica TaxID=1529436 RepID=UPI0014259576|nr:lysosomal protective protein-like [Anneissia japonica]